MSAKGRLVVSAWRSASEGPRRRRPPFTFNTATDTFIELDRLGQVLRRRRGALIAQLAAGSQGRAGSE